MCRKEFLKRGLSRLWKIPGADVVSYGLFLAQVIHNVLSL